MSKPVLLQITASILGENSQSTKLSNDFVARWRRQHPQGRVQVRDLGAQPLPHFDADYLTALSTPADQRSAEQAARVAQADALIAELKSATVLVLAVPMYNFGVPSQLKAWIDYVARAGSTFRYTSSGPEGLAGDRPTVVFATRGGQYKDSPKDSQTPYLRTFLNFIGINDIEFVYAEGLAVAERQAQSLQQAQDSAKALLTRFEGLSAQAA